MAGDRLELVWDRECPNVDAARAVIREALAELGAAAVDVLLRHLRVTRPSGSPPGASPTR